MTSSSSEPDLSDDPGEPAPRRNGALRALVEWVVVIAGAVVVTLVVKTFVLQAFYIPSESMVPTLMGGPGVPVGDRVLVNKLSYRLHDVHRGDVVVFDRPPLLQDAPGVDQLVKRVIGLPGDTITFGPTDHRVYVNGQALDEPWLLPGVPTEPRDHAGSFPHLCTDEDPCVVPDGNVWVMGDNRTASQDSRWFGPISEDLIVGRAFVKVWPLDRLGGL